MCYSRFVAAGMDVRVEDSNSLGRVDMAVHFNANICLFEVEVVDLEPTGAAMAQLKARPTRTSISTLGSRSI